MSDICQSLDLRAQSTSNALMCCYASADSKLVDCCIRNFEIERNTIFAIMHFNKIIMIYGSDLGILL